jgi:hypothetical protein
MVDSGWAQDFIWTVELGLGGRLVELRMAIIWAKEFQA